MSTLSIIYKIIKVLSLKLQGQCEAHTSTGKTTVRFGCLRPGSSPVEKSAARATTHEKHGASVMITTVRVLTIGNLQGLQP